MASTSLRKPFTLDDEIQRAADWFYAGPTACEDALEVLTDIQLCPINRWAAFSPHHPIPGPLSHNALLYCAMHNELLLAAASLQPVRRDPPRYRVSRWCTLPQYRHRRIGTTLLAVLARAATLYPMRITLLTHHQPTVQHLLDTRQWTITETRKESKPGPNAHRRAEHTRLPIGTTLYQLEPTLLAMVL